MKGSDKKATITRLKENFQGNGGAIEYRWFQSNTHPINPTRKSHAAKFQEFHLAAACLEAPRHLFLLLVLPSSFCMELLQIR
ncbi:MAG: hypothetical protein GY762_21185 [Proteobacteria bacterium]|nr:hypothetical protein [Pseudomonadota bacterium]